MSTGADMVACQCRNPWGYQSMAAGGDLNNTQASGASIVFADSRHMQQMVNLACWLSGAALAGVVFTAWLLPPRIRAELRAEFAQDVADTRAESRAAGTDAAIWKNRVMKLEAEANANRRR